MDEFNLVTLLASNFDHEMAAIEYTRKNFITAIKEKRYEDLGNWVTTDVKSIRPGAAGWGEMFALGVDRGRFPYDSIIMTPTETVIVNDSLAYDWGNSRVFYTDEMGRAAELRNSFLAILKKEDGVWKLHREVASSMVPKK